MSESRERFHGYTIEETIGHHLVELEDDDIGLYQIIPLGRRGFGFEGEELIAFTRRHLMALLAHGAVPVLGGIPQPQYGKTPEEITENIIAEWIAEGSGDPDVGGLWFSLGPQ